MKPVNSLIEWLSISQEPPGVKGKADNKPRYASAAGRTFRHFSLCFFLDFLKTGVYV
jgi:hypothetical protein